MEIISKLFSPSPFRYLHNHARETGACLERLQLQVEATLSNDKEAVEVHFGQIQSRVLVGRAIADEAFRLLSSSIMLPVRREDIISTIDAQNRMLDACGEIASLLSARSPSLNRDVCHQLGRFVREVLEFSTMSTDMIAKVNVLVHVGFEGPEADKVASFCDEMQLRKTKINLLRNSLLRTLFLSERDLSPFEHSFCLLLITEMGNIASLADKLTSRFRLFVGPRQRSPIDARRHLTNAVADRKSDVSKPRLMAASQAAG